jgi:hypothetical protein
LTAVDDDEYSGDDGDDDDCDDDVNNNNHIDDKSLTIVYLMYGQHEFDLAFAKWKAKYMALKKRKDLETLQTLVSVPKSNPVIDRFDGRQSKSTESNHYHYIIIPGRWVAYVKIGISTLTARELRDRFSHFFGPDIKVCMYLIQNSK